MLFMPDSSKKSLLGLKVPSNLHNIWQGMIYVTICCRGVFREVLALLFGFGKRGLLEKGAFQKSQSSGDSREFRDSRDFRESPESGK